MRKSSAFPPHSPSADEDAVKPRGAGPGTARALTFMVAIYTASQILVFKGMRIPAFDLIVTEELEYDYPSSVRNNADYRRSCNMPAIMDKGTGQGEHALL